MRLINDLLYFIPLKGNFTNKFSFNYVCGSFGEGPDTPMFIVKSNKTLTKFHILTKNDDDRGLYISMCFQNFPWSLQQINYTFTTVSEIQQYMDSTFA